jgi:Fur family ferric uptake transcriptional regulator
VIEFQSPEIERLQVQIARQHGYRIVDHRLEIYVAPMKGSRKRP